MRARCGGDPPIPIGDVMVHAFHVACENAALRRLVLSMALAVPAHALPADEAALLAEILEDPCEPVTET